MPRIVHTCTQNAPTIWSFVAGVTLSRAAAAAPCEPRPVEPPNQDREEVLALARAAAHDGRYSEARSLFYWLVEQRDQDQEAWLGMSLVDAWSGCLDRAEEGFRLLLARNARDTEARAGLIDVLSWKTEWDNAWANVHAGLALDPSSPALLLRESKLLFWSGDATRAADRLRRAEREGATPEDTKPLRSQLYLRQVHSTLRFDAFPAGYADVYTWGLSGLQRAGRFELGVGTLLYRRSGGKTRMLADGRHSVEVRYHPSIGTLLGLSAGFGLPSHWVPTAEGKAWGVFPIGSLFSGFFAYGLMQYGTHKSVHIFAPAFGFSPGDGVHLEARWWTAYVAIHDAPDPSEPLRSGFAHSIGFAGKTRLVPELTLSASYVYGTQLDENPIISRLFPLKSHIATLSASLALNERCGVEPMLGFERRRSTAAAVSIFSAELGAYFRWGS